MFILKVSFAVYVFWRTFVMLYKRSVFVFLDPLLIIGCQLWSGFELGKFRGVPYNNADFSKVVVNGWNATDRRPPRPGGRDPVTPLKATTDEDSCVYGEDLAVGGCRVWRSNRTAETATSSETDRLIARRTSRREARVRWGAGRKERSGCARTGVDASRRSLADAGRRAGAASGSHGELYPPTPTHLTLSSQLVTWSPLCLYTATLPLHSSRSRPA